jgi:hypothetical protein
MKGLLKRIFSKDDRKEKYEGKSCGNMVTHGYGENSDGVMEKTCEEIIDEIYRPFPTSNLKYYPHHGLYQKWQWNGAVSNTKGKEPTKPCGLGNDKRPKGLHVIETEYEIIYNKMKHVTKLSDGRVFNSDITFPKGTDSYLFGGIIKANRICADNAVKHGKATKIEFT